MADIPPVHISAAQTGFQSREVGRQRDARRAEQAHAASAQVKSVTDQGVTVDTTDADNQVFVNSEGAGSQGRAFDESTEGDADSHPDPAPPQGITQDEQGRLHIDLEG